MGHPVRTMARRSTPAAPKSVPLTFDELKLGIARLKRRIERLEAFDPSSVTKENARAIIAPLRAAVEDALDQTFGAGSAEYERYAEAARIDRGLLYLHHHPISSVREQLLQRLDQSEALLKQAVASLEERLNEVGVPVLGQVSELPDVPSRKIFLVHGQDTGAREAVARFLEQTGFEPIVLHEQPNQGRTIIEKFEEHSAVGFAVVLLTPDDMGGIAGGAMQPRARQNVILELGYFIGRLGRDKVCALKSGDIELPSDIFGVVWTAFDAGGGWKLGLAKELQAAGFEIDFRKVLARPS